MNRAAVEKLKKALLTIDSPSASPEYTRLLADVIADLDALLVDPSRAGDPARRDLWEAFRLSMDGTPTEPRER